MDSVLKPKRLKSVLVNRYDIPRQALRDTPVNAPRCVCSLGICCCIIRSASRAQTSNLRLGLRFVDTTIAYSMSLHRAHEPKLVGVVIWSRRGTSPPRAQGVPGWLREAGQHVGVRM